MTNNGHTVFISEYNAPEDFWMFNWSKNEYTIIKWN